MKNKLDEVSLKNKILVAFIAHLVENGEKPKSIFSFCKKLKINEADFYEEFTSFSAVDQQVWKSFFTEALDQTKAEEVYSNYSVREKLLSFYYTWLEILKANRSYILVSYNQLKKPIYLHKNDEFTEFKYAFYDFANELLMEAHETREVEQRAIPQIMQRYPDIFWAKTMYILDFWVMDSSKSFEKSDTLIEKSVNTVFDLLARSPLDSLLDLGKFIFNNRR
jgi:hypothetical protein